MQSDRFKETSFFDIIIFCIKSSLEAWIVWMLRSLLMMVQESITFLRAGIVCSNKNALDCEKAIIETCNKKELYWKTIKKDIKGRFAKLR